MSDIRLILCNKETKEIEITADYMHIPLSPLEEAIQRVIIAIMTTSGTMVEASGWGGSARLLFNKLRRPDIKDTELSVTRVVDSALASLLDTEPDSDFAVTGLSVQSVERKERGYSVVLKIEFQNATSYTVVINE